MSTLGEHVYLLAQAEFRTRNDPDVGLAAAISVVLHELAWCVACPTDELLWKTAKQVEDAGNH